MSRQSRIQVLGALVMGVAVAAGCSPAKPDPGVAAVVEGQVIAASETDTLVHHHLETGAEAAAGHDTQVHDGGRKERAGRFVLLFQIKHAVLRHLAAEMDIPRPEGAASPEEAAGEMSRAMAERLFPDLAVSEQEVRAEYERRASAPAPFPGVPAGLDVAAPSFAEAEAALRRHLLEQRRQRLFTEWFDQQLRGADIDVDERYGRWDPERGVVR